MRLPPYGIWGGKTYAALPTQAEWLFPDSNPWLLGHKAAATLPLHQERIFPLPMQPNAHQNPPILLSTPILILLVTQSLSSWQTFHHLTNLTNSLTPACHLPPISFS